MTISVSQKKEDSICGIKPSPKVKPERPPCFIPLFRISPRQISPPDCTRRDSSAIGVIRTLSRIDRIFFFFKKKKKPTYGSSTRFQFENWEKQSIPSDNPVVRVVTDTLPTRLARSQISKLFFRRPKDRFFVSSRERHLTSWEQSY